MGEMKDAAVADLGPAPDSQTEMVSLNEVAEITMGQSPPSSTYNTKGEGLPFLQGKAEFGSTHPVPVKWCAGPLRRAAKDSILISVRAPVGDVNIADDEYCIGRGLAAIRVTDADRDFVYYWLKLNKWRLEELSSGTTFKSINKSVLFSFQLPVLPIEEQRAIAHVLRTVQQAREATEQVIEATRELKRSLMRHLFTYGPVPVDEADQVPLKETEIGPMPEHWELGALGDLGRIGNGSTPKRDNVAYWQDGVIPWITSAKIHDGVIRQAEQFVTQTALAECHLPMVPKDSIVVAITGQGKTLGHAAYLGLATTVSQHLAYIRCDDPEVLPDYVYRYLDGRYDHLRMVSRAGGSTRAALTCGYLRTYPLPLPSREEQLAIVETLSAVDQKIRVEQQRHAALASVFESLLHHLMTGKVRVPDAEEAIAPEEVMA